MGQRSGSLSIASNDEDSPRVLGLVATEKWHNQEQTASCPTGFFGDDVTISANNPAYDSSVSQQNANDLALAAAEAALDCQYEPLVPPSIDSDVLDFAVQPDGKIIICGAFNNVSGTSRPRVARLNIDGSLDTGFDAQCATTGGTLGRTVVVLNNGKILLGGNLPTFNGVSRTGVALLNSDGSLDTSFNGLLDTECTRILLLSTGKIALGGLFNTVLGNTSRKFCVLNSDFTFHGSHTDASADGFSGLAEAASGDIYGAGSFSTTSRANFVRFNADGTLDTGFGLISVGASSAYSIVSLADSNVILGGAFTSINGNAANRIGRVTSSGVFSAGFLGDFSGGFSPRIESIRLQTDTKILIGGLFTTANATTRNNVARLNADGSLDSGFNPDTNSVVYKADVVGDYIYIGGAFTTVGGQTRNHLARLNMDGTLA